MSVLSVQTKKIPALQAATGLVGSDMIIVELVDGGTRKMTYGDLITVIQTSLKGDEDAMITASNISSIQTDEAGKVPSSALVKGMNDITQVAIREQRCINEGIDGVEWDLDELMSLVRSGEFNKFAIGDSFVDNSVHWRIHGKKTFPSWSFDGTIGETPNTITCLPDEALGTHAYNTSNTNVGGYAGSMMPNYLENTILPQLSEGLRSYIKETQILENNKGAWASIKREMRIPTVIECIGSQGWADQFACGVSSQLPLMRANRHRIKAYWYWCLDPVDSNTTDFCSIASGGYCDGINAITTTGSIRPEIVLG